MAGKSSPKAKPMDVQKPGDSKPDSSSRPILVTNRPILQDPMVVLDKSEDDKNEETPKVSESKPKLGGDKVIQPITEETNEKIESKQSDTKEPETKTETSPEDKPASNESDESAVVDAVLGSNKSTTTDQQKDVDEIKKHQALQLLVDSKKYILPVGKVSKARHNRNSIILLVIILLFAGVYIAIDLGYVGVPFELPIRIFK